MKRIALTQEESGMKSEKGQRQKVPEVRCDRRGGAREGLGILLINYTGQEYSSSWENLCTTLSYIFRWID